MFHHVLNGEEKGHKDRGAENKIRNEREEGGEGEWGRKMTGKRLVRRERGEKRGEREREGWREKGRGERREGDRVERGRERSEKRGRNSRIGRATLSSTRVSISGIQHFIFYTKICFLFDWLERVNYKPDTN